MEKRIVLTGGPGSGKTTVLNSIVNMYTSLGVKVVVVSETATEIINSGIKPFGDDKIEMLDFQKLVLSLQLSKEEIYDEAICMYQKVHPNEDILIIYDRGSIDNKAYITDEEFDAVMQSVCDADYSTILNKYDLIIDLVGSKKFYTLENNKARSESADVALTLGEKTLKSWVGHPKVKIVGPKENMNDKVSEVVSYINELLSKKNQKKQAKYLVSIKDCNLLEISKNGVTAYIEQYYLSSPNNEEKRIRMTILNGCPTYELTVYEKEDNKKILKSSKRIDKKIYDELKEFKLPSSSVIKKYRIYFTFMDTYMHLDLFTDGEEIEEFGYLEINLNDEKIINIPPFISALKDVSSSPEYDNYSKSLSVSNYTLKKEVS